MKDFHDLYSLIAFAGCLNPSYTDQVVAMAFTHRQTSTENLPVKFDSDFIDILQPLWRDYRRDLSSSQTSISLPESIQEVISAINSWLTQNTNLCSALMKFETSTENNLSSISSLSNNIV